MPEPPQWREAAKDSRPSARSTARAGVRVAARRRSAGRGREPLIRRARVARGRGERARPPGARRVAVQVGQRGRGRGLRLWRVRRGEPVAQVGPRARRVASRRRRRRARAASRVLVTERRHRDRRPPRRAAAAMATSVAARIGDRRRRPGTGGAGVLFGSAGSRERLRAHGARRVGVPRARRRASRSSSSRTRRWPPAPSPTRALTTASMPPAELGTAGSLTERRRLRPGAAYMHCRLVAGERRLARERVHRQRRERVDVAGRARPASRGAAPASGSARPSTRGGSSRRVSDHSSPKVSSISWSGPTSSRLSGRRVRCTSPAPCARRGRRPRARAAITTRSREAAPRTSRRSAKRVLGIRVRDEDRMMRVLGHGADADGGGVLEGRPRAASRRKRERRACR